MVGKAQRGDRAAALRRSAGRLRATAVSLPAVVRVRRELHRTRPLPELLEHLDRSPHERCGAGVADVRTGRFVAGVDASLRLLRVGDDACVPRSLALFTLLSRRSVPVTFVSGFARVDGELRGHAWVCVDGSPLAGSGDGGAPVLYAESFRYPSRAARAASAAGSASGPSGSGVEPSTSDQHDT